MQKNKNKGYMLVETLIVTAFVAGVLIFLFVQFRNLSKSYNDSFKYNTVEGLYALEDIKYYIKEDANIIKYIQENIDTKKYMDITDCSMFINEDYCLNLFKLENIDKIYITFNNISKNDFKDNEEDIKNFILKINSEGEESYRLIARFKNSTYSTIRFDIYE